MQAAPGAANGEQGPSACPDGSPSPCPPAKGAAGAQEQQTPSGGEQSGQPSSRSGAGSTENGKTNGAASSTENGSSGSSSGSSVKGKAGGSTSSSPSSGSSSSSTNNNNNNSASGSESNNSNASSSNSTTNVNITTQQRTEIVNEIKTVNASPAHVNFTVDVGVAVPSTVELYPLPPRIIKIIPRYRGYEFFLLPDGRIVIVEPRTLKIVFILSP
jgi:hypothetical protein